MVILMLKWFKNKIKRVPEIPVPKCARCGLRASHELTTTYDEVVIEFKLCVPCLEDFNAQYNSRWIPPLVTKEE